MKGTDRNGYAPHLAAGNGKAVLFGFRKNVYTVNVLSESEQVAGRAYRRHAAALARFRAKETYFSGAPGETA